MVLRGGGWWRGFRGPDGTRVRMVDAGVVWGGHDIVILLGVVIVLGRVSGAAVVTTGAGAEGFSSREFRVGAGLSTGCRWFG